MLNFIVLGYVPGTDFQLTFDMFMLAVVSVLFIGLIAWEILNYEVKQSTRNLVAIKLASASL